MPKRSRKKPERTVSLASHEVLREIDYIVRRAARFDGRVVTLGQLIYFSTDSGDAWMLDPEDRLALPLTRAGERLRVHVVETAASFEIGWTASYDLEQNTFVVVDGSGRRAIFGYPVAELARAERVVLGGDRT